MHHAGRPATLRRPPSPEVHWQYPLDTFFRATGSGSLLNLSNITTLAGGICFSAELLIEALDAGVVDLGNLQALTGGDTKASADGNGSLVDLAMLEIINGEFEFDEVDGGIVQLPNP